MRYSGLEGHNHILVDSLSQKFAAIGVSDAYRVPNEETLGNHLPEFLELLNCSYYQENGQKAVMDLIQGACFLAARESDKNVYDALYTGIENVKTYLDPKADSDFLLALNSQQQLIETVRARLRSNRTVCTGNADDYRHLEGW